MAYVWNTILLCLSALLTFLDFPIEPAVILASLMAIDFFSGLVKAYAVDEPITSKKMKAGAISKLLLLLIPLVVALGAKGVGVDWAWIVGWVVNVLILAEVYSFVSNVYCIRTRQRLPEWDVVHVIGNKLKKAIEAFISK